jgi:hypothetical protein
VPGKASISQLHRRLCALPADPSLRPKTIDDGGPADASRRARALRASGGATLRIPQSTTRTSPSTGSQQESLAMNSINATPAASAVTPPTTSTGNKVANAKVAITPLTRSPDAKLVTAINRIIDMMTGNAAFPTPLPTLAAVTTAQAAYVLAVNTLDRGQPAQIRRNDARAAVVLLVRELALYVQ